MSDTIHERLDKVVEIQRELEPILQSVILNDSTIIDALAQLLGVMQQMQARTEKSLDQLAEAVRTFSLELRETPRDGHSVLPAAIVSRDEFALENPEIGLLEYLYSFLADTTAIDIGANVGRVSERLLKTGYTVYAFEPYPPSFAALEQTLSGYERFHPFEFAIGAADGTMSLHIAADLSKKDKWDTTLFHSLVEHPMLDDLQFSKSVPVKVRSLESLRHSGEIPDSAGVLKIDTEGFDLEVMRGAGDGQFSVVVMEFWDPAHPFGLSGHGRLEDLVTEMKRRGYGRHIVIYHLDESSTISYYCNRRETVPKSWGNVLFFQDLDLFRRALGWCDQVLAPTLCR